MAESHAASAAARQRVRLPAVPHKRAQARKKQIAHWCTNQSPDERTAASALAAEFQELAVEASAASTVEGHQLAQALRMHAASGQAHLEQVQHTLAELAFGPEQRCDLLARLAKRITLLACFIPEQRSAGACCATFACTAPCNASISCRIGSPHSRPRA